MRDYTEEQWALSDKILAVLEGAGLSGEPWEFDSSIHSWRCEHPDRYGRCSHLQELVDDLMRVAIQHD